MDIEITSSIPMKRTRAMFSSIKGVSKFRAAVWYCTDSKWRKKYRESTNRIMKFRQTQRRVCKMLLRQHGPHVISGPFTGMKFPASERKDSYSAQMLLGTYERELHDWITRAKPYDAIIVIGAAEGYFAIGMGMLNPDSRIIAFESEGYKHSIIQSGVEANALTNVEVMGFCDMERLKECLSSVGNALLIVDIDGGEYDLLDPDRIPELLSVDMIVETHDMIVEGVTEVLKSRFASTHSIDEVASVHRTTADLPAGVSLSGDDAKNAMDEFRGGSQGWLLIKRRR